MAAVPATIGIVAGEASGDALAATLIEAVRARHPGVRFAGIAGPRMQAAGCEAWYPLEALSVRGFVEVVGRLLGRDVWKPEAHGSDFVGRLPGRQRV